jgi:hypothetical protein
MDELNEDFSGKKGWRSYGAAKRQEQGDAMDWQLEPRTSAAVGNDRGSWGTRDEIEKRRQRNLCFRCGRGDYYAGQCTARLPRGAGEGSKDDRPKKSSSEKEKKKKKSLAVVKSKKSKGKGKKASEPDASSAEGSTSYESESRSDDSEN